jgi:hypothetical protein
MRIEKTQMNGCGNYKGIAFWRFDESGESHLYFVISDVDVDGNVLIVNVSHFDENRDKSCELGIGDHRDIKKRSIVFYKKSFEVRMDRLLAMIMSKEAKSSDKLSAKVLKKIQDGARKSKLFPNKLRKYFEKF